MLVPPSPPLLPTPPVIDTAPDVLKLDLACGNSPRVEYEGVDIRGDGARHKVNVQRFPWPWATSSVDAIHCSHYIEHIPAWFVDKAGDQTMDVETGKDALFAFFDECFRILKPDAPMTIVWPDFKSNRGFMDPTHRRYIPPETMNYLSKQWRESQKLDHYNVECNYEITAMAPGITLEFDARCDEVKAQKMSEDWNQVIDWHATLVARKPKL